MIINTPLTSAIVCQCSNLYVTSSFLSYDTLSYLIMLLQMSSSEDSYISDTSSEGSQVYNMVVVAVLIARLKAAVANVAPVVNPAIPFPKMSGRQWMQLNL